jgi:hypothetical protein
MQLTAPRPYLQWQPGVLNVDYGAYFAQCAPASCAYTLTGSPSAVQLITSVLGLIGGLATLLYWTLRVCPASEMLFWWSGVMARRVDRAGLRSWGASASTTIDVSATGTGTFERSTSKTREDDDAPPAGVIGINSPGSGYASGSGSRHRQDLDAVGTAALVVKTGTPINAGTVATATGPTRTPVLARNVVVINPLAGPGIAQGVRV